MSYFLFFGPAGEPADVSRPLNLAHLYTSKLITSPKIFYDPGLRHPEFLVARYEMKYYENAKYSWPKCDDRRHDVRGSYMYYPQSDLPAKTGREPSQQLWSLVAEKSSQLTALRSVVTDLIFSTCTRPHTAGRNPVGINVLWGDMHVSFSTA